MWEDRLQELLAFQRSFGHVQVPRDWPDNPPLARWVINLRRQIRTGALTPARRRRLDDLHLRWPTVQELRRGRDREWDRYCDALMAFHREHGHGEVPGDWAPDPRLGPWVARLRHQWRAGLLREDRRRRLEDAGISWSLERGRSRTRDGEWDRMCDLLSDYRREHGHCDIPKGCSANPKLTRWLIRQRHYLRNGSLRPDRRMRLEELGVDRSAALPAVRAPGPRERAWNQFLESLAAFRQAHGHCNVPRRWPWNRKLARWVHYQRTLRRRGLLDRRRGLLLDALGFQWLGRPLPAAEALPS